MENVGIAFIPLLAKIILDRLARKIKAYEQNEHDISQAIENHITEVFNWARNVQFLGMSTPLATDVDTIALDIDTEPRRFRSSRKSRVFKQESDLLSDSNNYLLLGEPGSGKTTTVKRLSLLMFNESQLSSADIYQFPIVIRLREMKYQESIYTRIADVLGIHYEVKRIKEDRIKVIDQFGKETWLTSHGDSSVLAVGKYKINDAIHDLLNKTKAVVLLDGLDELSQRHSDEIRQEIVNMGLHLTSSKIIVTCRSGQYFTQMDNFNVVEMSPLTTNQIISIKI